MGWVCCEDDNGHRVGAASRNRGWLTWGELGSRLAAIPVASAVLAPAVRAG
jgi:hypothetical protein